MWAWGRGVLSKMDHTGRTRPNGAPIVFRTERNLHCLCSESLLYQPHGEEFETGMRSDERHLENFGVLLHQTVRVSWFPSHSISMGDVASNNFHKIPTLQVVSTAVFE